MSRRHNALAATWLQPGQEMGKLWRLLPHQSSGRPHAVMKLNAEEQGRSSVA